MEDFSVLELPTLEQNEYEVASSESCTELHNQRKELNFSQEGEIQAKNKFSSLKINVPCPKEVKLDEGNHEDEIKTPTSMDHVIQVPIRCPPAPRKPKSQPHAKRRAPCWYIDFSSEVESMFPAALRADLGGKIKKVRIEIETKL